MKVRAGAAFLVALAVQCWSLAATAGVSQTIAVSVSLTTYSLHTVSAMFDGPAPSGPDQAFQIALTLTPSEANVSSYAFRIYYDSAKMSISGDSGYDNTGQPGAGFALEIGPEIADTTTFPGFDVYRVLTMSATAVEGLLTPSNLGGIHASTTTGNASASGIYVRLMDETDEGLFDEVGAPIPHTFDVTAVPVTVSHLSIE